MKLSSGIASMVKPVPGVFTMSPILRGSAARLTQNRRGTPELVQDDGRVIAVSDAGFQLLAFAAINGLPVKNFTDTPTVTPEKEPAVFCLD